jgi:non-ribosomal peptide synthetase component E (peptide arylation enzyme)
MIRYREVSPPVPSAVVPASSAPRVRPPTVAFGDRVLTSDEMVGIAAGWRDVVRESIPATARLTALPLSNHPEAIALLFALSSLSLPVAVYPPDPRAWRSDPPVPAGTPLFIPPCLRDLESARVPGLVPRVVPAPRMSSAPADPVPFLACPGFVNFTSGSTGRPKPVYITTESFLLQTATIIEACALSPESAVAGSLQLSTHYGLGQALLLSSVLGSPLGLLDRFEPNALLALFATHDYAYWAGTPIMADLLTRAAPPGARPRVPRICHISAGKLPIRVFDAFTERFGVKLRPNYGQTENGFITVDLGTDAEIRPDCVGRAAPGIEVRIGDDPRDPYPPGRLGRVWFTSPWYMEGYGFPPHVSRAGHDGWWPTADVGLLDDRGYLTLAGRADDCFKTASGYLVNPGEIIQALATHPGVVEVVILPVEGAHGPAVGAVVEAVGALDPDGIRATASRLLPPWLQPQVVVATERLPRLSAGKADRKACLALLAGARGSGRAGPVQGREPGDGSRRASGG